MIYKYSALALLYLTMLNCAPVSPSVPKSAELDKVPKSIHGVTFGASWGDCVCNNKPRKSCKSGTYPILNADSDFYTKRCTLSSGCAFLGLGTYHDVRACCARNDDTANPNGNTSEAYKAPDWSGKECSDWGFFFYP